MLKSRFALAAGDVVMRDGRAYVVIRMMRRTVIAVPIVIPHDAPARGVRGDDMAMAAPGSDLSSAGVVFRCGRLVLGRREDFVRAASVSSPLFARISDSLRCRRGEMEWRR